MKELLQIQSELKAPKGQFNASGKYKYRSCEDILEAVSKVNAETVYILPNNSNIILAATTTLS